MKSRKKVSKKKKQTIIKEENKGFTLIELLAVIAVLFLIVTIVIYTAMNVIDNAKSNSYKVTVNNIQDDAISYITEKLSANEWIAGNNQNGNNEYQCITVQNLIDAGYYDSDVLNSYVTKDRTVLATDYIYLEREPDTKTILKNVLLIDERYEAFCNTFDSDSDGNIIFDVVPSGWAKEKTVTIRYNIYNADNISDYEYGYYDNNNIVENNNESGVFKKFNFSKELKEIKVIENGPINAEIYYKGDFFRTNSKDISKIDKEVPTGIIESTNKVSDKQEVKLTLSDQLSGISEYYFGKSNPEIESISWIKIDDVEVKTKVLYTEVKDSGTYYLVVKDNVGNISDVVSKEFFKTELVINYAFVSPRIIITMKDNSFTLPVVTPYTGYSFYGWYRTSSYSGGKVTSYTPTSNSTLYGKVLVKEYAVSYNANGGSGATESQIKTHGIPLTIKSTKPIRTGYTFVCWNTKADGTGTNYSSGETYTLNSSITLYAQWKALVVTIKYQVGSGETLNSPLYKKMNNLVYYKSNNKVVASTVSYGSVLGGYGLSDYNNDDYINIIKTGHTAVSEAEWKCVSGDCEAGTTYDQNDSSLTFTDFCDVNDGDCEVVLGVNWRKNVVKIRYSVTEGNITSRTTENGITNNWTIKNNIIYRNGVIEETTINYGDMLGGSGLNNYNNSNYINVSRNGYNVLSNSEWICLSDSCKDRVYSQKSFYTDSPIYNASDFCNASNGDCEVTLGVNWVDNIAPVVTVDSDYKNKWYNGTIGFPITINVIEYGSGVDTYAYSRDEDNGNYLYYGSCTKLSSCHTDDDLWRAERNEEVSIRVCDIAGNCGYSTTWIRIDRTPPTINSCSMHTVFIGQGVSENSRIVTFDVTDSGASSIRGGSSGLKFGSGLWGPDGISVTGEYVHSVDSSAVGELSVLYGGSSANKFYQTFLNSGYSNNTLTISNLRVCDNANNCSTYNVSVPYGSASSTPRACTYTKK